MDVAEYEKLNGKYRKNKEKVKELEERALDVISENKELTDRLELFGSMEQEFGDLKEIMEKQAMDLADRNGSISELVEVITQLKGRLGNYQDEVETTRREKGRLLASQEEKESKWSKAMREQQNQAEQK